MSEPTSELEKSRGDLLDLSLRNPLLNFRPFIRRGVEVVHELSSELFRILVLGERVMYFRAAPEEQAVPEAKGAAEALDDIPTELLSILTKPAEDSTEMVSRHTDNKLQTAHTWATLNLRLRETFRQARLSIEEQGVNILYLALGMLRWYEPDSSTTERRAPLVLVPVRLTRSNVRDNFKLSWTKDEIEPNLSLEAELKELNVRLPEMPSEDELDVDDYLAKVERAVAMQPRWSVEHNEVHLSFFSFSKLLIYKDLDPTSWPEENQPASHPLVQQLFGNDGFVRESSDSGEEEYPNGDLGEVELHPVVDADSSQTLAVLDAMKERNLVIQGPPGTGKSQTITNLIGEALFEGKTVLFVAEKMAALEVVKRRLDSVHLGDACLELHSHNTNKRAVLEDLQRTLSLDRPRIVGGTEDRVLLKESRKRLNEYSEAVNTPVAKCELTPYQLVGRLAKLEAGGLSVEGKRFPIRDAVSWSAEDFTRRRMLVDEVQMLVREIGVPRRHPWWVCGRLHVVPTDVHAIREVVAEATAALHRLRRDSDALGKALRQDAVFRDSKGTDLERAIRTVRRVMEAPELLGAEHRHFRWATDVDRITEVANAAHRYVAMRSNNDAVLKPEAWDSVDRFVFDQRHALVVYGNLWWGFLSRSFRDARRRVRERCRAAAPKAVQQQIELCDAILEAKRLLRVIAESGDVVARFFPALTLGDGVEAHRNFVKATTWLVRLHRDEAAGFVDADVHDLLDHIPDRLGLKAGTDACEQSMEALGKALDALTTATELRADRFEPGKALEELTYGDLDTWLRYAHDRVTAIQNVVRFNQLERRASKAGIEEAVEAAASREDASRQLTGLFEHACYSAWLDLASRERPALAEFNGATHAGIVERFRELDRAQSHQNQTLIAERHWQQFPRHHVGGQLGVLRREFQKKARHMPIRRLMKEAGRPIQSIKPVFMMSPLSIAKYIPPGSVDFDLVVFDEASQVRPVEALGALIRGRQAVVVGDSKQLPPTSFFDRMADGGEEGSQTADLESILGMFCAQGAPERMLKWHYRSHHESLITVSNHEFYDDRLVVFPSPDADKADTGLVFRHDPGAHYQRRGINAAEAKTVALSVMEHARNTPRLTLGVAAFSNVQARRIEDEVDILRRHDPSCEEFFAGHPEEPFFVKNLENVQGDERDVILISVGYGKIDGAYLPMNFGPLNRVGGERRLNVLITRARRRCVVYCNFVGADLDLRKSGARGVEALKTFLEYAQTGSIDIPKGTEREVDSPFEEAVAAKLRTLDFDVEHQVGSAGFFIDLAVRDPSRPGRYVLGIQCDGASYHSARSARDRDRLRQQVLEGLGWKIHRIWSTDWLRDPEQELARVEEAVRAARAAAVAPQVPPAEPSKPLERAPEPESEVAPLTRPYELAELDIGPLKEPLHEVSLLRLVPWIGRVVAVESPIHLDEVTLRICTAVGVRSGSRIREKVKRGAHPRHPKIQRRIQPRERCRIDPDGFLWRLDHETCEVRRRDGEIPSSLRNPWRIAPKEIGTALMHAVRASYGITPADAVREASRLFGFKQAGRKIVERFQQVLDQLVADGEVVQEGSLLQVPTRPARS